MSLEERLAALTTAVEALTAKLNGAVVTASKPGKTDAKAETKTEAKVENTGATTTNGTTPPATKPEGKVISYDDLKAAVISLASKKGREVAVGVLAGFGVDNAQKLTPTQYDEALAALVQAAA